MIIITDLRVSVFCNVMATIFGVMALACGLAALAEDNWKIDEVTTSGLWKVCSNTACEYIVLGIILNLIQLKKNDRGTFWTGFSLRGVTNIFDSEKMKPPRSKIFARCSLRFPAK